MRAKTLAIALNLVLSSCGSLVPALAHDPGTPFADWFMSLKQPDWPASCCGLADQYYVDLYEPSKVTPNGYRALVPGFGWVEVPPNKIIRGKPNPTGRGVIFIARSEAATVDPVEPYVYCFVPADEV